MPRRIYVAGEPLNKTDRIIQTAAANRHRLIVPFERPPSPAPQCVPTDEILVAPLEPGIADARLAYLERVPANIHQPCLLHRGTLERFEGDRTPTVWYGLTLNIMPLRLRSAIRI